MQERAPETQRRSTSGINPEYSLHSMSSFWKNVSGDPVVRYFQIFKPGPCEPQSVYLLEEDYAHAHNFSNSSFLSHQFFILFCISHQEDPPIFFNCFYPEINFKLLVLTYNDQRLFIFCANKYPGLGSLCLILDP